MSQIALAPEELREAAGDFKQGQLDSLAILLRLEKTTSRMQTKWEGVSQRVFFRNYTEWKRYMEGMATLLQRISTELQEMADTYERADS
jgi:WXG100 family type VII secretion target